MVDDTENGVPSDALLNTTANQTAVGAILTTDLLDGYLTTDNLAAVTNHLGTRVDITDVNSAGVSVALTGYDTVWESIQTNRDYTSRGYPSGTRDVDISSIVPIRDAAPASTQVVCDSR